MIKCTDPAFVGTTVYTTVSFKDISMSRLKRVLARTDGTVDIYTKHSHFVAAFSDESKREEFVATCKTIGVLELC